MADPKVDMSRVTNARVSTSNVKVDMSRVGPTAKKKKGGGGVFGVIKAAAGGVADAAHWTAGKTELAARDVKAIPGGVVGLGRLEVSALKHDAGMALHHPTETQSLHDFVHGKKGTARARLGSALAAQGHQTVHSLEHPLADPFLTALNVGALAAGGAAGVAKAGYIGDAARAGEAGAAAKALSPFSKVPVKPRLLKVGDAETPVSLHASASPGVRAVQGAYDKVLQRGMDVKPKGRVAAHAQRRIGGAANETARLQARIRATPADALDLAARRLAPSKGRVPGTSAKGLQRVQQAALELTSTNTTPEKAAAYHLAQAEKGVNPALNRAVSKLYQKVADQGLLTTTAKGDVIVDEAKHPQLAVTDVKIAKVQGRGDEILSRYNVRSPEALAERVNAPGRIREGAAYETPTAAKAGVPSQGLLRARSRVTRLEALYEKARERALTTPRSATYHSVPGHENLITPEHRSPTVQRLSAALSVAKDELQSMESAAANRVKPTGIVGGETARPGRGFVSYATAEKKAPTSGAASSAAPVVGEAKAPVTAQPFTGTGIEKGMVPKDVTGQAARHFRQITRFVNTTEFRNQAIKTGSDTRRSTRDVLMKEPGAEEHARISQDIEALLGKKKLTTDDLAGIHAALEAHREDLVPGLADKFSTDKRTEVGQKAPAGYKWVDQGALGDLGKPGFGPRGRIARKVDAINSAVTAATVYFKIGHVGTRVFTNAATNIIQGSAVPREIGKSASLWKQLGHEDRLRALAASGQHGYAAMPHEGTSMAAKAAGAGANWWAKHADAPFRFNSIAYEARRAGFDTPAKFRDLLDKLENPEGLNAAQTAKVDWVAKRANREGIAYDRLNELERRYITRAVWFYPWIAGTVRFAGNTLLEHPYKSAVGANLGVAGHKQQQQELGDLPSYEGGLFKLGGPAARPLVADFSTFSPFVTPADVAESVARPKQLSDFLNPALTAVSHLAFGLDQFGAPTTKPYTSALSTLTSPTPEMQILAAYLNRGKDQSGRMFRTTPKSALTRSLVGPGTPRRVNLAAAHKAAGRERSGR